MGGPKSRWWCLAAALSLSQPLLLSAQGLRDGLSPAYRTPPAPELALADVEDNLRRLSDRRGEVVVINFWATWCPPCLAEMPAMQRMFDTLHDEGLEVFAVNAGERADAVRRFLREFEVPLTFTILLDLEGQAFEAWSVRGLPKTYVVDRAGNIAYVAEGGRQMDSEHILGLLRGLLESD